jgi:hypothetical protein
MLLKTPLELDDFALAQPLDVIGRKLEQFAHDFIGGIAHAGPEIVIRPGVSDKVARHRESPLHPDPVLPA